MWWHQTKDIKELGPISCCMHDFPKIDTWVICCCPAFPFANATVLLPHWDSALYSVSAGYTQSNLWNSSGLSPLSHFFSEGMPQSQRCQRLSHCQCQGTDPDWCCIYFFYGKLHWGQWPGTMARDNAFLGVNLNQRKQHNIYIYTQIYYINKYVINIAVYKGINLPQPPAISNNLSQPEVISCNLT